MRFRRGMPMQVGQGFRRHATLACGLILSACSPSPSRQPSASGGAEVAKRVRIAECGPARETCLTVDGVSAVAPEAMMDAGSTFGGSPLTWMRVGHTRSRRSRVLVLFDVSGSMTGEGMASARPAVSAFLSSLDEQETQVGVAPFESHSVASRIRSVTLGPPSVAVRSLDALPRPGGNTGLYSAIREGAALLAAGGPSANSHLIVVTDGVNDVRAGDDAALLTGPAGLADAVDAATRASVQVWTIGVGAAPDRRELASLAGSDDRSLVVATDPLALARALVRIAGRIRGNTVLLVGTAAAPALGLSASARQVYAVVRGDGTNRIVTGEWWPPLIAPPLPARRFTERGISAEIYGSSVGSGWWRWALLSMPIAFAILLVVPVSLAMEIGEPEESQPANESFIAGGLRESVREARPRSPDEVTASGAERIVRMPGR